MMKEDKEVNIDFKKLLEKINQTKIGKRPETAIRHMLKHGHITTETLKNKYGYQHPPRAIQDVKDLGIPITKQMIGNSKKTGKIYTINNTRNGCTWRSFDISKRF